MQGSKGGNREACRQACRTRLSGCAAIMNVLTQVPMRRADVVALERDDCQRRRLMEDGIDERDLLQKEEEEEEVVVAVAGEDVMVLEHELEGKVKVLRRRRRNKAENGGGQATSKITHRAADPHPDFSTYLKAKRMQQQQQQQQQQQEEEEKKEQMPAATTRIQNQHMHRVGLMGISTSLAYLLVAGSRGDAGRASSGSSVSLPRV